MRAATFCALVCSVFLAGNVDAEETGSTQANVETIKNQTFAIMQDVDALRSQVEMIVDDVDVLSQLEYWFRSVSNAIDSFDTYVRSGVDLRPATLNVFRDYFDSVQGSMASIRGQLQGVGTVTNFLGQTDFDDFRERLANQFMYEIEQRFPQWLETWATAASWFVYPGDTPYIAVGTVPFANDGMPLFDSDFAQSMGSFWVYDAKPDFERWFASLSSASNRVSAATTNLLTVQNATLDRVAEYVAGVSNAVGTISNEYETDPTGSNDLPSAEKPKDLAVEKSVDTSSLEEAVQQTFDGLDGLTPTGSSKVPEIVIQEAYRGNDPIKVRLDLSEIGIATRVCKACWAILLAVGVLGIVRSEWDYWTTLGGSAT